MKKQFILAISILALAGIAACSNTVHGAGKDIENSGEAVQNAIPAKN